MADKLFLRATTAYEAPNKRLQNDIEITGATITRSGGRITGIAFSGGGGGSVPVGGSYATNADAVAALGVGQLYQSTTLVNGSPIILITV